MTTKLNYMQLLLVVLFFGFPNFFVLYDVRRLDIVSGSFDINVLIRIFVLFLCLTYIVVNNNKIFNINLAKFKPFIYPLSFYLLYLCHAFFFQPDVYWLLCLFRIFEYLTFFIFLYVLHCNFDIFSNKYIRVLFEAGVRYLTFVIIFSLIFFFNQFYSSGRLGGSVIHPNTIGILACCFSLYLFILKRFIFSFFFFLVLILTYSRADWLIFLITLVLVYFYKSKKRRDLQVVFFILMLTLIPLAYNFMDNLLSFFSRGQSNQELLGLSGRSTVWLSAIHICFDNIGNFIRGVGFGKITEIVSDVMSNEYNISYWRTPNAHNDFLQALLSGGFFYFLATIFVHLKILNYLFFGDITETKVVLLSIYFPVMLFSFTFTTINYYFHPTGALIWFVYLFVSNNSYKKNI